MKKLILILTIVFLLWVWTKPTMDAQQTMAAPPPPEKPPACVMDLPTTSSFVERVYKEYTAGAEIVEGSLLHRTIRARIKACINWGKEELRDTWRARKWNWEDAKDCHQIVDLACQIGK